MAQYFSIFLVTITVLTGIVWLINHFIVAPKREEAMKANALKLASASMDQDANAEESKPSNLEEVASFFPWLAAILILRSFLFEPFQIPTGSMIPTLLVGDFIWVEKYAYGLKDPVTRTKLIETGTPEYGDIAVFKFPKDESVDFIKRIIGLPGDVIRYRSAPYVKNGITFYDKALWIKRACRAESIQDCGKFVKINHTTVNQDEFFYKNNKRLPITRAQEDFFGIKHDILITPYQNQSQRKNRYFNNGTSDFVVPEGQYFVMGDNRDNSEDSRFWGFVKDEHLVGKAVAIWISFEFNEQTISWLPSWFPVGIRFNRIGGLQ